MRTDYGASYCITLISISLILPPTRHADTVQYFLSIVKRAGATVPTDGRRSTSAAAPGLQEGTLHPRLARTAHPCDRGSDTVRACRGSWVEAGRRHYGVVVCTRCLRSNAQTCVASAKCVRLVTNNGKQNNILHQTCPITIYPRDARNGAGSVHEGQRSPHCSQYGCPRRIQGGNAAS
jgi:hypothetical protein